MKTLLLAFILTLAGCAWFGEQRDNIAICASDPACFQWAMANAHKHGQMAGEIASLTPVPAASPVAKTVVGYISLLASLIMGGAALKKKKEPA